MRHRGARGALLLALLLGACTRSAGPAKPLVVASFYPLYEFSRQVAGDRAEVVSLVPPGVEPHDWEPSPQDVARVEKAQLFVYNGAGFEPWVDRLLRGGLEPRRTVRATDGLPLVAADLPRHEDGPPSDAAPPGDPRRASRPDPHVWLDPVLASAQVERIRAGLERVDGAGADAYAANARAFRQRLAGLHAAFEGGLRDCARRDLVTSHAAFGYLARRYGLTVVPVMGLAPESEPSAAQLAAIVQFARRRQVRYIFFETLVNPRLAETLAREVGARTLVLNPVEGVTAEERAAGRGYVELMEDNLENLRIGLTCR
jgi:zinc transport system substrate-binding protein